VKEMNFKSGSSERYRGPEIGSQQLPASNLLGI